MNNFSTNKGNKKNRIIFMMFVCLLLSNVAVFGQTAVENNLVQNITIECNEIVNTTTEISSIKQEVTSTASNMNFVLWFMGSKQSPNSTIMPAGTTAKKQFMTSGTAPNRLLIKAFLKKAVNFESAVV